MNEGRSPSRRQSSPKLRQFVLALDHRLRRRHSVIEFTRHPQCVFRIQVGRLERDLVLADGTAGRCGDRVIELHFWNEQIPPMPEQGALLGWAHRMNLCMLISLRELAQFLARDPTLKDVCAVRGTAGLGGGERAAQYIRIMQNYGFEFVDANGPEPLRGRLHRLAENVLITLMVLACNPAALRRDTLRRIRSSFFMSRQLLERRYGKRQAPSPLMMGEQPC